MKAARFRIGNEMLQQVLHMPAGCWIMEASMSDDGLSVVLVVTDPALPEAAEPHDVEPVVKRYEWDWGLDEQAG
jgi:hypothetical protein